MSQACELCSLCGRLTRTEHGAAYQFILHHILSGNVQTADLPVTVRVASHLCLAFVHPSPPGQQPAHCKCDANQTQLSARLTELKYTLASCRPARVETRSTGGTAACAVLQPALIGHLMRARADGFQPDAITAEMAMTATACLCGAGGPVSALKVDVFVTGGLGCMLRAAQRTVAAQPPVRREEAAARLLKNGVVCVLDAFALAVPQARALFLPAVTSSLRALAVGATTSEVPCTAQVAEARKLLADEVSPHKLYS